MAEYSTELIEKVHSPPLVHDCTHPDSSDDDDGAQGAHVAMAGMPSTGDVPTFDGIKHVPTNPAGNGTVVLVADDGEPYVLGGLPNAPVPISSAWVWRDLTGARWAAGQSLVDVAGAAGSYLDAEYSLDEGATWPGTIGVAVPVDTAGPARPDPVPVPNGAQALVLLRPIGGGGDGESSPEILNFLIDFTAVEPT